MAQQLVINESTRRELWIIADCVNTKAVEAGFTGNTIETQNEVVETLANEESGFAYLDDMESRLGLDVAEERDALIALHNEADETA